MHFKYTNQLVVGRYGRINVISQGQMIDLPIQSSLLTEHIISCYGDHRNGWFNRILNSYLGIEYYT